MSAEDTPIKHIQFTDTLYDYLLTHSVHEHEVLKIIRYENRADHLTTIMQIAPEQAQFMAFMVKLLNVKRVLEIGTSTGYSSLAMALALPDDGQLITCDINPQATSKAREYWRAAKVDHKVSLHVAPALESLDALIQEGMTGSFDLAFIDADKTNYDAYFEACMKLVRVGGLILIDNVLWGGAVADENDMQADTVAIRELNNKLYSDPRIEMSMLPLADGLTLVLKK